MIDYHNLGMVRAVLTHLNWSHNESNILIETGTHRGGGAEKASHVFDEVHTIELSEELYDYARTTYKDNTKIKFYQGNSPEVLRSIVSDLKKPYVLFLDAHGSGGDTVYHDKYGRYGTPIIEELEAVRTNPPSIIIIDDYKDYSSIDVVTYIANNLGIYEHCLIQETPNWNFAFKKV